MFNGGTADHADCCRQAVIVLPVFCIVRLNAAIWIGLHNASRSIPPQRRVAAPGGGYEKTEVQTHVQGSFRPVVMMGNP